MSETTAIETFVFGSREINYELSYQDRKTLGIRVYPDCKVKVVAPLDTSQEKLKTKLREKAPWIIKQQLEFLSYHPLTPPRKYINGETHLYLGRQYRLLVKNEQGSTVNEVKLDRGRMVVYTADVSVEHVSEILNGWYRKKAEEWLTKLLPICQERFPSKYQLSIINCPLSIRYMPTRWGSCTPKGKVILNPELIKAPKGSIEYVIIHELCHLIHHNHTRAFYNLQEIIMPDWKKWKERLETTLT